MNLRSKYAALACLFVTATSTTLYGESWPVKLNPRLDESSAFLVSDPNALGSDDLETQRITPSNLGVRPFDVSKTKEPIVERQHVMGTIGEPRARNGSKNGELSSYLHNGVDIRAPIVHNRQQAKGRCPDHDLHRRRGRIVRSRRRRHSL
jgi:hypothetical protein